MAKGIVGHEQLIADLINLADRRALSHAYVFFGPERSGKRLVALSLASYLEQGKFEPPGSRPMSDLRLIEPTAEKTIGIDAVRAVKHFLHAKPNQSPYRTLVIDGAEHLSTEAENALLKITEEPPSSSLLIAVVRDPELLRPTLVSRMHKVYFSAVEESAIADWLMENKKISAGKAKTLAKESFGSPGFAVALIEDRKFQNLVALAGELLDLSGRARSAFIKKLLEPKNFDTLDFLDALAAVLAGNKGSNSGLWHRLLALRRDMRFLNLNPRLQLEGLFA